MLEELARVAFFDIREIANWGESGVVFVPSGDLSDDAARALVEVSSATIRGEDWEKTTLKVKMADKLGALRDLGRHLGMFTDKVEHSGTVTLSGGLSALLADAKGTACDGE